MKKIPAGPLFGVLAVVLDELSILGSFAIGKADLVNGCNIVFVCFKLYFPILKIYIDFLTLCSMGVCHPAVYICYTSIQSLGKYVYRSQRSIIVVEFHCPRQNNLSYLLDSVLSGFQGQLRIKLCLLLSLCTSSIVGKSLVM